MKHKKEKLSSAIQAAVGEYLANKRFDDAMVTVTSISLSRNFSKAIIGVSVFPESKEKRVVQKLNRGKGLFAKYVKSTTRISNIPLFSFVVDEGEKHRQRIDELSRESKTQPN